MGRRGARPLDASPRRTCSAARGDWFICVWSPAMCLCGYIFNCISTLCMLLNLTCESQMDRSCIRFVQFSQGVIAQGWYLTCFSRRFHQISRRGCWWWCTQQRSMTKTCFWNTLKQELTSACLRQSSHGKSFQST